MKTIKEKTFWSGLSKHLPGDTCRIENMTENGTPDVNGCFLGRDYWIELKVCSNKAKERNVRTLLSEEQLVWHFRRVNAGGLVFVAVKYPFGVWLYRAIEWKNKVEYLGALIKDYSSVAKTIEGFTGSPYAPYDSEGFVKLLSKQEK